MTGVDRLRCARCGDVIGPYEPATVILRPLVTTSSLKPPALTHATVHTLRRYLASLMRSAGSGRLSRAALAGVQFSGQVSVPECPCEACGPPLDLARITTNLRGV
ncbi:MAG: hypothetical protein QOJ35_3391, partial [Solirubrobacteraceae bacterium]|nr:hypothetical protein [Solirubrobacteraceae bacterium]